MDTMPLAAPAASTRHVMRFEGTTSEYFKIWIVNLALTIVTLGIFSAWAKVRSKRYLYGNTFVGAHAFDYHADPLRILLGRAIALVLLMGYSLTSVFARPFAGLWFLLFAVVFPGLVMSSLRFSARNTSYRNIRFDFGGTYGRAFRAFVLWYVFAAVTFFIALPFAHRARDYYIINNHSYGKESFRAEFSAGPLYAIYGGALGLILVTMVAVMAISAAVEIAARVSGVNLLAATTAIAVGTYALAFLVLPPAIGALTFNLALNNTKLGEGIHFESHLSAIRMSWITVSNLIAVLFTLGLLYPWARIRATRYRADCITVIGPPDLGEFSGEPMGAGSAVGEEIASFFDIDFGL
jgi:uncharacterized membrane protein YjgN (DUF898 family)